MGISEDFVFHPSVVSTIRFKSYQLVRGRSDHTWADIPDLEQDMSMHLWQKRHHFDPARGNEGTFASTVLDRWIAQYLRDRGRIKRGGFHRTTPFSQYGGSSTQFNDIPYSELLTTRDGDRRRWRHTESHIERFDRIEALGVAMSLLTASQRSLLDDVAMHSVSYAARQRGVSRRQINNKMAFIRKIFIKCGLNIQIPDNR